MAAGIYVAVDRTGIVPSAVAGNEPNELDVLAQKINEVRTEVAALESASGFVYPGESGPNNYFHWLNFQNDDPPELANHSVSFNPKSNTLSIMWWQLTTLESCLVFASMLGVPLSVIALIVLIAVAAAGFISGLWVLLPIVLALVFATKLILSSRKMLQQGNQTLEEMVGTFQKLAFKHKCRLKLVVLLPDGARTVTRTISSQYLLACGKRMIETLRDHTELPHELRLITREYLYVIPKASA